MSEPTVEEIRQACAVDFYDPRLRYVVVQMDTEIAARLGLAVYEGHVDGEARFTTIAELEERA